MMYSESENYKCKNCDANITYDPLENSLSCEYCGTKESIIIDEDITVEEKDYQTELQKINKITVEEVHVKCENCGAEIKFEENITTDSCPFCDTKIVASSESKKCIKPDYLLPFKIDKNNAVECFKRWLKSKNFLPNKLKKNNSINKINGMYIPYWTYDCNTVTDYTGERGEYYYDTETYTERDSDGKRVTKTREVRRTRWYDASGTVCNSFDDVLVLASNNVDSSLAKNLNPWKLEELVPYKSEYLSGFIAESYSIGLEAGFDKAKKKMSNIINYTISRDIGGDDQRIWSKSTNYFNIKFKHILLPLWICSFTFNKKLYRFLINARTGEVSGNRPYSALKIIFFIIGIVIIPSVVFLIITGVLYFFQQ